MVRFGILGAGNIARRFAASLAHVGGAELVAASCRTAEKAGAFLDEAPCAPGARAYGTHDELLADRDVDAIYLALPHALHRTWATAALRAGKPVLCEKPACLTATEMAEVADVAQREGVLFMEAMKPRFQPLYPLVMAAAREIAPIVRVEASLCNDMLAFVEGSGSYHLSGGAGAGVLLDCGTYCASWVEELCQGVPRLVSATGATHGGVDVHVDAWLECGGVDAHLTCAFDRAAPRTCTIVGERGTMLVDELHRPTRASVSYADGSTRELRQPYEVDDFFGEISHFAGLVARGERESPVMPLSDSVHCALVLDAIRPALATLPPSTFDTTRPVPAGNSDQKG